MILAILLVVSTFLFYYSYKLASYDLGSITILMGKIMDRLSRGK
tara:strand:+ start:1051 stop:1182 length:132 start_codon:yes stop_codon:yes gene_type:complete